MPTTRIMSGLAEFLPGQGVGRLRVQQMVSRRPEPKYEVKCDLCNTIQVVAHTQLRNESARCKFSGCGKSTIKKRERLEESEALIAQRKAELEAAQQKASAARMEYETDGHERPLSFAEQQAKILRERRDQEARAEQEAIEAPRREAEQQRVTELRVQQENTLRQLHAIQRERIATGTDDEFTVDPATVGASNAIPQEQVAEWQQAQFDSFLKANPGYFRCDENAKILTDYFERNAGKLPLLSAVQLTAAYKRLNEYGLLKQRPAPQPAEPAKLVPEFMQDFDSEPAKAPSKPQPVLYHGWDLETGERRTYTEREINKLSSEQMAKALQMRVRGELELPRTGPGPLARKQRGLA